VTAATATIARASRVSAILDSIDLSGPATGPGLFLLSGLPGAGKSTLARTLAIRSGAVVLESDRLRALLFASPVHSPRESGLLFSAMRAAARTLLQRGHGVIVDATNVTEADRRPFYQLAEREGVPLFVAAVEAPSDVVEARLQERSQGANGYAFADSAVYHRMKGRVENITRPHLRVDTSDAAAVRRALGALLTAYRGEAGRGTGN
jgi:predicted kinase